MVCHDAPTAALVKSQVESQIKVRDFSNASVSIHPADYSTWDEARAHMVREAKRPLKALLEAELSNAADEDAAQNIRAGFSKQEADIEHAIDHKPMEFHASLGIAYNVCTRHFPVVPPAPDHVVHLCTF